MNKAPLGIAALPIVLVAAAQDPPAVVTRLCAMAIYGVGQDTAALQVVGGDWLDKQTADRWVRSLIPHVRDGLATLGIESPQTVCWRISLRVPDAVALSGRPCQLEGTSADAACMAVLIASALGIKTRSDTLLTGSLQLDDQRVGLVGMLPEKLMAAADDSTIHRFIHAPIDRDGSGAWTVEAITAWDKACHECKHRVKQIACSHIAKAVKATLSRDSYIIAAIRHGLLHAQAVEGAPAWVNGLRQINDASWLKCLDRRIHTGRKQAVERLLEARLQRAVEESSYPTGIGVSLHGSLQTVPLGRRRSKLNGLLISTELLESVTQSAGSEDVADLEVLAAATGHAAGHDKSSSNRGAMHNDETLPELLEFPGAGVPVVPRAPELPGGATPEEDLDWLIASRAEYELSHRIDRQLDEARMSFVVDHHGPWKAEAFLDLITSFYAHLHRAARLVVPSSHTQLSADAMRLLDQAYKREGGYKYALANAREGTHGGIRKVLDTMTEARQFELRNGDRFNTHLLAIDHLQHDKVLAQTKYVIDLLGPFIPERFKGIPPELLVNELDALIEAAVNSGNHITQILRNH